jgi:hypothetical protein
MSELKKSFTDQTRQILTEEFLGHRRNMGFFCHLCGTDIKIGDGWRWVYTGGVSYEKNGKKYGVHNPTVCDNCDGENVIERWVELHKEFYSGKFRSLRRSKPPHA